MKDMWMLVPVLFPIAAGGLLWMCRPRRIKMHVLAAALSLGEAVFIWLVILKGMGASLDLWEIGPGMALCLRLDGIGALFSGLAAVIWPFVVIFSFEYMEHEKEEGRFSGCLFMSLGALAGVAFAGNFVTLYLFFELLTFFSAPLVFHSRKREAMQAGMVYLAYSILGASIALGGYFFFRQYVTDPGFVSGGILDGRLLTGHEPVILISVFCMAAGFACKAGLMPLHAWLPIAHPVAPAPASALLSGLITKAGVVAVIRVIYDMAGPAVLKGTWVQNVLLGMTVLTIFTGSMLAYKEKKLKKRLAYSSFSQVSYVLFGIFLLSIEGLYGSMLQMIFHALAKNALFLCAGAVICKTGCTRVKEMRGMGKRMPAVMVCFALASLSLVGIPPAGGFLAKWHLAVGAMSGAAGNVLGQTGAAYGGIGIYAWLGPVVLMVSALLTAGYLFPIIVDGFFPGRDWEGQRESTSLRMRIPLAVLAGGLFILGTVGTPVFEVLRRIAAGMM